MASAPDLDEAQRLERLARRQAAREGRSTGPGHASLLGTVWGRALAGAVVVLGVATAGGLLVLWPGSTHAAAQSTAMGGRTVGATVQATTTVRCPGPTRQACRRVSFQLKSGGARTAVTLGPVVSTPSLDVGAHVRLQKVDVPPGSKGVDPYAYAGPDRRSVLLWVGLVFALLIVVLARFRGLLALVGFALSLLLVTRFMVPAILAGSSGLLVALVGSFAVMFITVVLTYGVTAPSLAACVGIGSSLLIAAVGAEIVSHAAHLDGRSSELASYLAGMQHQLSLEGVVLAGMVIATLGVLADMGVTQASAVMALRHADPRSSARRLFVRGFRVGRDHLVATTHTLVLVYVGATLPLLLVMNASGVSTVDAINSQDLAEPILGTLIGAIALLVSVPLTTLLTALVVARIPADAVHTGSHAHAH